jgi:hypothetical protein
MDNQNLMKLNELLGSFLEPQIKEVVNAYGFGDNYSKYFVEIPDISNVDLGIHDIANLVAKTSNAYGRAARFAGMARAHFKLTEGRYKTIYKKNRIGKNEAEREASAMLAAENEYQALVIAESLVHLAESIETSSRIASESARKLMDKMQSMQIASAREEKGFYTEKDFSF